MAARISRFTPGLTPRDQLEGIFVARQPLLDDLVDRVRRAVDSVSRQHTLIVGPRGSGKTHLLALTYYRVLDLIKDGARVQVARLPEDPWTIGSYARLLTAILQALPPQKPDQPDLLSATVSPAELEHRLAQRHAADGVIVVIVENLDEIFRQITPDGQRALRHFLQTSPTLLLLASTPALDRSLTDQTSPFYNYFSTLRLEPLEVDQALDLVRRLARGRDDAALEQVLGEKAATARFQAIEHLAGGQPRLWVTFGQILTPAGIRRLADTLLESFDDLTPYYQDRLRSLSGDQRLVVAELATADRPLHVQDIARRLGKPQNGVAARITELRDLGWVEKVTTPWDHLLDGRRSYYELAEPLARLAFQVKESWGEPIRLIVEFLSYWFDPDDAAGWRGDPDPYMTELVEVFDRDPEVRVVRQLTRLPESKVPDVELLGQIDDALAAVGAGDAELILALPTAVRVALEHRCRPGGDAFAGSPPETEGTPDTRPDDATRVAGLPPDNQSVEPTAVLELPPANQPAERLPVADSRSEVLSGPPAPKDDSGRNVPWEQPTSLAELRREIHRAAMEQMGWVPREPQSSDWIARAENLATATGADPAALTVWAEWLARGWRFDQVHAVGALIPADHLVIEDWRVALGQALRSAGRYRDALALDQQVVMDRERLLGPDHRDTLRSRYDLATDFTNLGRHDEALALDQQTLADRERVLEPDDPDILRSRLGLATDYAYLGHHDEALALRRQTLADSERVLGPDHPDTLGSRHGLAIDYSRLGRHDEALTLDQQTLADRERVLGPDHPDALGSRHNLAIDYSDLGRYDEALTLDRQTLADRQRVLGPDHPATLSSRHNLAIDYRNLGRFDEARAVEERRDRPNGSDPVI